MSELYQFIKKRVADFAGISCRKLYGLDAFYLSEKPFIVISQDEEIIIKVDDFETQNQLKTHQVTEWKLNNKLMKNWFVLPKTYNKKKNRLTPILEMTAKVLLKPKKEKKQKNKKAKANKSARNESAPDNQPQTKPKAAGFLAAIKRIFTGK